MNRILDSVANKGIAEHYALRKLLIEQQTEKLIKEKGVEQVVVIGAGFDSMALRLHKKFPSVDFTEIDLPTIQELKRQSLARGLQVAQSNLKSRDLFVLANNFHFVAADLAKQPLNEVLTQPNSHFDPAKNTLFIAEGVSMYLTAEDNQKLIQAIHCSSRNRNFVLMGIAEETALPDVASRTMKSYGEQYRWSLPHMAVKETMAGHGLNLLGKATYAQLQHALPSRKAVENPTGENYYLFETQKTIPATTIPLIDLTPRIPLSQGCSLT
jgi:methyltransferase (TIGR00027 family)